MANNKGKLVQVQNTNSDIAISVQHVAKTFRLPHNRQNTLKSAVVNLLGKGDRTYETQKVLKDVSFDIKKGEFFGIVGRNGSGKSTLLKMLAGIYTPTEGLITVNGTLTPFIELGVGFNPELTGRENVYLNGALLGFNNKEMDAMYDDIVSFAELERFMDQKLKNYSSGMQVRLAFSIAIRAESDILVLDEVLAVGDEAFQRKCYLYFDTLKKENKTVVLVTHDMSAVQRFCTRALFISSGDIKVVGDPSEVSDAYRQSNLGALDETAENEAEEKKDNKGEYFIASEVQGGEAFAQGDSITVNFSYNNPTPDVPIYVGFSIIKDGVGVAELNNLNLVYDAKNNHTSYHLATKYLNPGAYEITATLFQRDTRMPVAHALQRAAFIIKGFDENRGGALTLDKTWTT